MFANNTVSSKRIKITAICFALFSIAIIIYVLATNLSHIGKIPVEIKYAPYDATVFIDNQNYPVNNAVNYLEPGQHHIIVTKDGYETLEQDIEVTPETKTIFGSLKSLDSNNSSFDNKNQKDFYEVEGLSGKKSAEIAQALTDEYPILNYLPYIDKRYSVGTVFDDQNNLTITVRAELKRVEDAINKLRSFDNVSLSGYDIIIYDFQNVLAGKFVDNGNTDPIAFLADGYQNLGIPYQVNPGQQEGDYYYTTITVGKYGEYPPVTYRAVLQKTGATWKLVGIPSPILNIYNTPNVDRSILDSANQLDAPIAM